MNKRDEPEWGVDREMEMVIEREEIWERLRLKEKHVQWAENVLKEQEQKEKKLTWKRHRKSTKKRSKTPQAS